MIERKRVVAKVVELMDQIGDLQADLCRLIEDFKRIENAILAKAIVVDHLMWVLDLGDPQLPGS